MEVCVLKSKVMREEIILGRKKHTFEVGPVSLDRHNFENKKDL